MPLCHPGNHNVHSEVQHSHCIWSRLTFGSGSACCFDIIACGLWTCIDGGEAKKATHSLLVKLIVHGCTMICHQGHRHEGGLQLFVGVCVSA